jgi:hypothetical protein
VSPAVCETAEVLVAIVGGLARGWLGLLEQPAAWSLPSAFAAIVLVCRDPALAARQRWEGCWCVSGFE